ncbi:MAG TPA: radical SAM protein [Erysipelothrix sp.]|nr:radical SAM protein [Erysipelothrix sp.]
MSIKTLYVHIPYCDHINGTWYEGALDLYENEYINRLVSQIDKLPKTLNNIYVGGGTPTKLTHDNLKKLLKALQKQIKRDVYEFTFEENPLKVDSDKLMLLQQFGVNRIALGHQLSNDLDFYNMSDSFKKIKDAGIHNISVDLPYGLPNQTVDSFLQSLESILKLKPNHISLNEFAFDNPLDTKMYLEAITLLEAHGYDQYEISNFALESYKSQQNLTYWHYEDYYGLGCQASQKIKNTRQTWTDDIGLYITGDYYLEELVLDKEDEMFEYLMMNLRLKSGFKLKEFNDIFNVEFHEYYQKILDESKDLIQIDDETVKASPKGFLLLDELLINFL